MAFELPFSTKTPPLIGLDVGSSSVKLVELTEGGGTPRLERYAIEPLPRGAVVDGNVDKIDIVAEAVRLLEDPREYERMARIHNPYGDGEASRRISEIIEGFLD